MDADSENDEDVMLEEHGEMDASIEDSDDMDEPTLQIDTTVRKSAYMTEKSTKKKMLKDGKVGTHTHTLLLMWSLNFYYYTLHFPVDNGTSSAKRQR